MFHCNTDYTMFHYYLILKVVLVNLQAGARVLPDDRLQLLRLRKQSRSKDESWTSTTPIPSSYTSGSLGFPFRSTAMRLKWGEPLQTAAGILGVGFLTCFFSPRIGFLVPGFGFVIPSMVWNLAIFIGEYNIQNKDFFLKGWHENSWTGTLRKQSLFEGRNYHILFQWKGHCYILGPPTCYKLPGWLITYITSSMMFDVSLNPIYCTGWGPQDSVQLVYKWLN